MTSHIVGIDLNSGARLVLVDSKLAEETKAHAQRLRDSLDANLPPNASGFSRLLPWNWKVEPVMPDPRLEGFYNGISQVLISPVGTKPNTDRFVVDLNVIRLLPDPIDAELLIHKTSDLLQTLEQADLLFAAPNLALFLNFFVLAFCLKYIFSKSRSEDDFVNRAFWINKRVFLTGEYMTFYLYYAAIVFEVVQANITYIYSIIMTPVALFLLGTLLRSLDWPRNPHLPLVKKFEA